MERVGHFLSNLMLTFKFSHFLAHSLVQMPFHSPSYLCILQYSCCANLKSLHVKVKKMCAIHNQ